MKQPSLSPPPALHKSEQRPAITGRPAEPALLTSHRVVCVSNGFQTNYERGFCNALAAHGTRVTLLSSDATDRAGLAPGVLTLNLRGSQDATRPRWRKLLNLLRYHLAVLAYAPFCSGAVVHMIGNLDPAPLCGVLEAAWFRLWCRRYVLTVHDLLPHDRHTAFNRWAHRVSFRIPTALVVHTERMRQGLIERFGIAASRITVMQHGIEPDAVQVLQEAASRPQPQAGPPLILLFGKIEPYKGVDVLLHALRDVDFEFRLVIAGRCTSVPHRALLLSLIASHPQRARIEWRDRFIEEVEMEQLFQSSNLLTLPYRHIDQSGVLFQALRFGVPVVATRAGSFEDFVTPAVGELADVGNAASLTAALQRWFARRDALSRQDIRAMGAAFEWPLTVLALRSAYGAGTAGTP